MRTEKEIERMLGRVINANGEIERRNKEQRQRKEILYGMMQILHWIRKDGENPEEQNLNLITRIAKLAEVPAEKL